MSDTSPWFYAWCDEVDRGDTFVAALSALADPGETCFAIASEGATGRCSLDKLIAEVRADLRAGRGNFTSFDAKLSSGRVRHFYGHCYGIKSERQNPLGPLDLSPFYSGNLFPTELSIAYGGGPRSLEVEAAIWLILFQPDVEDLLFRLCAPDASARVPTGGCTEFRGWSAPIEIGATYHADAAHVARDLALSWVHLHDKDPVSLAAGMSMDALHARVDSAPHGARVPVKGGGELSRETVLRALETSPSALLDALEASTLPDNEWCAIEPLALETIAAAKVEGTTTYEADLSTRKHHRFLQHHAPYHVRRLPNGGVMLATHPFRTLWQLWSDALWLLDLTP